MHFLSCHWHKDAQADAGLRHKTWLERRHSVRERASGRTSGREDIPVIQYRSHWQPSWKSVCFWSSLEMRFRETNQMTAVIFQMLQMGWEGRLVWKTVTLLYELRLSLIVWIARWGRPYRRVCGILTMKHTFWNNRDATISLILNCVGVTMLSWCCEGFKQQVLSAKSAEKLEVQTPLGDASIVRCDPLNFCRWSCRAEAEDVANGDFLSSFPRWEINKRQKRRGRVWTGTGAHQQHKDVRILAFIIQLFFNWSPILWLFP